jgi:hypothetical protein
LIYLLNSIQLRAAWTPEFIGEQIAAQVEFASRVAPLLAGIEAPALPQAPTSGMNLQALEALRDSNDGSLCALIDWNARKSTLEAGTSEAIEAALRQCMDRQLKLELQTSARPMFAEISSGAE